VIRLTDYDRERIDEACTAIPNRWAVARFWRYVRQGFDAAESMRYTLCWIRNMTEQKARRLAHDTGAEGWHRPWSDESLAKLPTRTSQLDKSKR